MGFSQSTLFILLNLPGVILSPFAQLIKWLIPPIAILFFLIRGYAKITVNQKRANESRFYSTFGVIGIIFLNLFLLGITFIPELWIGSYNLSPLYWGIGNGLAAIIIGESIDEGLKSRYSIQN